MKEFTWVEKLAPRRLPAWLVLFRAGEVRPFNGRDIPGWCVVRGRHIGPRNGRWTPTTWRLVLADEVIPVSGHYGWDTGDYPEGLWSALGKRGAIPASWAEWTSLLAGTLGVPPEGAKGLLRAMDAKVAAAWDAAEEKIKDLGGAPAAGAPAAPPEPHPAVERNRRLLEEPLPPAAAGAPTVVVTVDVYWRPDGDAEYHAPIEVVRGGEVVGRVIPFPPGPMAAGRPTYFWWAAARTTGAVRFDSCPFVGSYVGLRLAVPAGSELRHPTMHQVTGGLYDLEPPRR